jgi:hypothetical protein
VKWRYAVDVDGEISLMAFFGTAILRAEREGRQGKSVRVVDTERDVALLVWHDGEAVLYRENWPEKET